MINNKIEPTTEQLDIIDCEEKNLIINALAGSGKTSTLIMYANKYPNKKFLYLAYNKSIKEEAEKLFPKNVKAFTFHSLAWAHNGKKYINRINKQLNIEEVINFLDLKENYTRYKLVAQAILNTLNIYCSSNEKNIEEKHVDIDYLEKYHLLLVNQNEEERNEYIKYLVDFTKKLWEEVIKEDSVLGFNHDYYLKRMCNEEPEIKNYDCIFVDEAQDLTPCFIDFLNNQKKQMILVGDKYQSIYTWRGSVNYIEYMNNANPGKYETKFLSKSFRFGPQIADIANSPLCLLKTDRKIKGFDKINTKVNYYSNHIALLKNYYTQKKPVTFISRSNLQIYDLILQAVKNNIEINLVGNLSYMELKELESLYKFQINDKSDHEMYSNYKTFKDFEEAVVKNIITDIDTLKRYHIVVSLWKNKTPENLKILKDFYMKSKNKENSKALITITTVHKAKGKEFSDVIILNDFNNNLDVFSYTNSKKLREKLKNNSQSLDSSKNNLNNNYVNIEVDIQNSQGRKIKTTNSIFFPESRQEIEELNLIYVAMTRAKNVIHIPVVFRPGIDTINALINDDKINIKLAKDIAFNNKFYLPEEVIATIENQYIKNKLNLINEEKLEKKFKVNKI